MFKIIRSFAIIFFICGNIFAQADPITPTPPAAGDGLSWATAYEIASLNNLYWIAKNNYNWRYGQPSGTRYYFKQTAPIDASETETWFSGTGFPPLNGTYEFGGNYDGQGFEIRNLHITRTSSKAALVTDLGIGMVIQNAKLIDAQISSSANNAYVAGFSANNLGNVSNCYISGTISAAGSNTTIGGIVAYDNLNTSLVTNCTVEASITNLSGSTGGIVGYLYYGQVTNSNFSGTITVTGTASNIGGVVGYLGNAQSMSKCCSKGVVYAPNCDNVGGLVGFDYGSIYDCYSHASVTGKSYVAGLVGYKEATGAPLQRSYSTGSVTGTTAVSGFASASSVGVSGCYWDTETSGRATSSAGGTGKTTAEMKDQATFSGWDFTTTPVWAIDPTKNGGYPYLNWQTFNAPSTQASNIVFSSVITHSMTISWTKGSGYKRAVFMKAANSGTAAPVNGSIYTANTVFSLGTQISSSGWYCIYNGYGNNVSVTGLDQNTEYIVQVFEYNDIPGSEFYLTSAGTNNPKVQITNPLITPVTQAHTILFSDVISTQIKIGWTNGSGENRAVFMKQAGSGTASPADNTTYTASTTFAGGTQIGSDGWYCVYNGTGNSVTVTGLTLSTDYIAQVFEYTGLPGTEKYLTSTASDNPKSQTSAAFINTALSFDGGDYVSLPGTLWSTNFSDQGALTVEYWFKGTDLRSVLRAQDGGGYFVAGWLSGASLVHIISTDGTTTNGASVGTTAVINNNSWHHIAVTWQKGGLFTSYFDGVQVSQRAAANVNLPSISSGIYLGSYNGTSEFSNGVIDEVRVWNVARTAQQINDYKGTELAGNETGLVAYYKMSNGSGTTLTDNAAAGTYAGTLGGTTYTPAWINFGAPVIRAIPTTQANTVVFSDKTDTEMTISWTNGNGANRVVFLKQAGSGTTAPADNTTYTANTVFGNGSQISTSGWFCVYNGSGSSLTVTGLTPLADYIAQVFEYNGAAGSERYYTFTASGNPSSDAALPVELTSFTAGKVNKGVEIKWTTATEVDNYGFEIERNTPLPLSRGDNATVWEKVGFVKGSGNSNSPKEYSFVDTNPISGNVQYRLKQINFDGSFKYFGNIAEINFNLTDVKEKQLPTEYALEQNYPNPFNPTTKIQYAIPSESPFSKGGAGDSRGGFVTLKVYDILGNEVATLVNEHKAPGYYEVELNGSNLSTGVYIYRLTAGNFIAAKKLMLMK